MIRAEYPDLSKLTAEQREQFDRVPIHLTHMLLHCPVKMVRSFIDFALSFRSGNLDPKMREGVILRMASLCGSAYELSHHRPAAELSGLSKQEIVAITSVKPSGLNPKLDVMIQLVEDCFHNGEVSDSTLAKLSSLCSTEEIAEATLLAGLYQMLACFLKTMGVGMDPQPLDWKELDRHRVT